MIVGVSRAVPHTVYGRFHLELACANKQDEALDTAAWVGRNRVTVALESNPTVARRQLAMFLKRIRDQRERSREDIAKLLGVDASQASRLDSGARGYRTEDVRRLAAWYGLDEPTEARLLALAEESRKRAWWQQVDLPNSYRSLIGLEQVATTIREYIGSVIPGLLQTREYARAAIAATSPGITKVRIETAVEVRTRRQQILVRDPPPELLVVVDESALARVTGGRDVMRGQLEHLVAAGSKPNVTIQVIGFEYGTHPGVDRNFILLSTPDELPDMVYTEGLLAPSDSSQESKIAENKRTWRMLSAIALDPRSSADRIEYYIERLAD